jgi:hypothetical protein
MACRRFGLATNSTNEQLPRCACPNIPTTTTLNGKIVQIVGRDTSNCNGIKPVGGTCTITCGTGLGMTRSIDGKYACQLTGYDMLGDPPNILKMAWHLFFVASPSASHAPR